MSAACGEVVSVGSNKKGQRESREESAVLNRAASEVLSEVMTCDPRLEGGDKTKSEDIWEVNMANSGSGVQKRPGPVERR